MVLLSGLWFQSDKDAVDRFFTHICKMRSIKMKRECLSMPEPRERKMNPRLLFPLWPKVFCKEGSLCVRSGLFLNHVSAALLHLVNSGLKNEAWDIGRESARLSNVFQ